jgi:hypothetical protein
MKTYTITVADGEDDRPIKRAMLADALVSLFVDFDNRLRSVAKYSETEANAEAAETCRDCLHDAAADYGILISELWE